MKLTRKELKALTVTGYVHVHIDAKDLTPVEATKLVKRFEEFCSLPLVTSSLTVIHRKE